MNKSGLLDLNNIVTSLIILQDEIFKEIEVTKMSRLDELINKLCPHGVEYKKLDELLEIRNGYTPSKSKKEFWINGTIPWFRMDDIRKGGTILSKSLQYVSLSAVKKNVFPANSLIIATTATIGVHALITVPYLANQQFTCLILKKKYIEKFDPMFLYYYCFKLDEFCLKNKHKSNFASVDMEKFKTFKFPIPPLEVQKEIVAILDRFDGLCNDICKGIPAEIKARSQQYEYYRDKLLDFKNSHDVEYQSLTDICGTITTGKLNANRKIENGAYMFFTCDAEPYRINEYAFDTEAILVSGNGNGHINYYKGKFNAYQRTYVLCNFNSIESKYLFHYLKYHLNQYISTFSKKGTVPYITLPMLQNFIVPIPAIEEQIRIVNILDKFTKLNAELNAELKCRRKQYEYYRDKLLTFKKLS